MSGPYLVGIDLGTQSAKVEVLDAAGSVVAAATRALRPTEQPYPGAVEHPGDDLWDAMGSCVREALGGVRRRGAVAAATWRRRGCAGSATAERWWGPTARWPTRC